MKTFLFCIFLSHLFFTSYSFENIFDPVPKGNGKYNSKYSHNNTDNLFFIFEHFRHGARSPCTRPLYNGKDLLGGKWNAVGELSEMGRKQHFLLGAKNRQKYNGFIKKKFDPQEILIFSTHYNRTIMSAQSHLLGFYNNLNFYDKFNFDVKIDNNIFYKINNIIPPIHLFEKNKNDDFDNDEYIPTFKTHFNCPYMHEMFLKNLNDKRHKIYDLLNKFNNEYFQIIKKEYGITNTTKYTGLCDFCDAIICDYFHKDNIKMLNGFIKHGKKLEVLMNSCYEYLSEHFFGLLQTGYAREHGVITMSSTMKKIIKWMEKRLNKNKNYINYDAPKYVIYSGHDDTMTSMQRFLKTAFNIEFEFPPFASNQLYELRKYGNEFYVELYYNDLLKLNITFKSFAKRVSEIALNKNQIHNKCYANKNYFPSYLNANILFLGIIFLLLLGIFIYVCSRYFYNSCDEPIPKTIQIV